MCVAGLTFNNLSTDLSAGLVRGRGIDLIPEQNWAGKVVFSGGNSNQGRVIFSLVGRERVNTGMEKPGTYN